MEPSADELEVCMCVRDKHTHTHTNLSGNSNIVTMLWAIADSTLSIQVNETLGIVHPKIHYLSLFTYTYDVLLKLHDLLSSAEHIR